MISYLLIYSTHGGVDGSVVTSASLSSLFSFNFLFYPSVHLIASSLPPLSLSPLPFVPSPSLPFPPSLPPSLMPLPSHLPPSPPQVVDRKKEEDMSGLPFILVALPLSTVQNLTEHLMTTASSHDSALKMVGVTAMSYNII